MILNSEFFFSPFPRLHFFLKNSKMSSNLFRFVILVALVLVLPSCSSYMMFLTARAPPSFDLIRHFPHLGIHAHQHSRVTTSTCFVNSKNNLANCHLRSISLGSSTTHDQAPDTSKRFLRILIADKIPESTIDAFQHEGHTVLSSPGLDFDSLPAAVSAFDPHIIIVRSTRVSAAAIAAGSALEVS